MRVLIIVSRYNEDLEWVETFPNVIIYNKGKDNLKSKHPIIKLPNVGKEGHTYYTYIYNNYDKLNDYTIFLQGNPFDHDPNNLISILWEYVKGSRKPIDFEFISKDERIIKFILKDGCPEHGGIPLIEVYDKLFNDKDYNTEISFGPGAQFIVSKERILSNPKELYKKIIDILGTCVDPIEGYVIERFHNQIFMKNIVEPFSILCNANYDSYIHLIITVLIGIGIFYIILVNSKNITHITIIFYILILSLVFLLYFKNNKAELFN